MEENILRLNRPNFHLAARLVKAGKLDDRLQGALSGEQSPLRLSGRHCADVTIGASGTSDAVILLLTGLLVFLHPGKYRFSISNPIFVNPVICASVNPKSLRNF